MAHVVLLLLKLTIRSTLPSSEDLMWLCSQRKVQHSAHVVNSLGLNEYEATFSIAILLRQSLYEKLPRVTPPEMNMSRNVIVAASIARSRIKFYFSQRLRQRCHEFLMCCLGVYILSNVTCNMSRNDATKESSTVVTSYH